MPAPEIAPPEVQEDIDGATFTPRTVLPVRDDSWIVGTILLTSTAVPLLFGHTLNSLWRTLIGILCLLFALRALLGLWTLGFVPAQSRRPAFFERGNQTLLGALALVCAVLLLR